MDKSQKYATLYFDISDPEIMADFNLTLKAGAMSAVLWDVDQKLRAILKYHENIPEDIEQKLRDIRAEILEFTN